jgi:glycosyltransferase involved in cell wall biosynthesis
MLNSRRNSTPKISIVIATFNAAKTLEKCLQSIFSQTYPNVEVLVADGASSDRTVEILDSFSEKIAYRISEKDRGIYDAWNKVLPHATGEWVLFLGADDELFGSDTLTKIAPYLAMASEKIVYGKVALVLPSGEIGDVVGRPWEEIRAQFPHVMNLAHQGVFQSKKLFEVHGLFDANYRICGDYEFLLRELKNRPAVFVPEVTITRMSLTGVSSEFRNISVIIEELARAQKANGLGLSPYIVLRRFRHRIRLLLIALFGKGASEAVAKWFRKVIPRG